MGLMEEEKDNGREEESTLDLKKLQVTENSALHIATRYTSSTATNHLHEETQVLPLKYHINIR